jgi:hypothetical protein
LAGRAAGELTWESYTEETTALAAINMSLCRRTSRRRYSPTMSCCAAVREEKMPSSTVVALREPISVPPNHEPGTSISTHRSTCSGPGYRFTNSTNLAIAEVIFETGMNSQARLSPALPRGLACRPYHATDSGV